jgi:hypothetical protein
MCPRDGAQEQIDREQLEELPSTKFLQQLTDL